MQHNYQKQKTVMIQFYYLENLSITFQIITNMLYEYTSKKLVEKWNKIMTISGIKKCQIHAVLPWHIFHKGFEVLVYVCISALQN